MGYTVLLVFVMLAAVVAVNAIKIVPQGREYTVERFGRYTRTLKPGISFLTPFVETVGRRVNLIVIGRKLGAESGDYAQELIRIGSLLLLQGRPAAAAVRTSTRTARRTSSKPLAASGKRRRWNGVPMRPAPMSCRRYGRSVRPAASSAPAASGRV